MVDPSVKFASGRHTLALEVSQTIPTGPAHPQSRQTVGLGPLGKLTAFFLTRILTVLYLLTGWAAHLRQLRCERRALGPGWQTQSGGLHCTFDQMLARLGNYSSEAAWWRRLILSAEGDYVLPYNQFDPHFLRIPAIRDWLDNWYVRADLKVLATEKLLTGREENVRLVRQRLAESYARFTSEEPALATAPINAVLQGLIASALSRLSSSERIILELIRESNLRISTSSAHDGHASLEKTQTPRTTHPEQHGDVAVVLSKLPDALAFNIRVS